MASQHYFGVSTQEHPVDTGVENAKTKIETSFREKFTVSEDDVSKITRFLREIRDANTKPVTIPEEFESLVFELVALTQFQRIKEGNAPLDKSELEKLTASIWEIIERWLKPPDPKK